MIGAVRVPCSIGRVMLYLMDSLMTRCLAIGVLVTLLKVEFPVKFPVKRAA